MHMTCDADCTRAGWQEAIVSGQGHDLHVSYPKDTDLDGYIRAFCHDAQEMITITGWLVESIELIDNT